MIKHFEKLPFNCLFPFNIDVHIKYHCPLLKWLVVLLIFNVFQIDRVTASDSLPDYQLHSLERVESLLPYMVIYTTTNLSKSADETVKSDSFVVYDLKNFKHIDYKEINVYWQKFSLYNSRSQDSIFYLYNKFMNYWQLYQIIENKPSFVAAAGRNAILTERNDSNYFYVTKIVVPPGKRVEYLTKYQTGFYERGIGLQIASQKHYNNGFYPEMLKKDTGLFRLVENIYAGIFFVFSIYSFLLYIQTGKKVYLFYAIFQVLIYLPMATRILSMTFLDSYSAVFLTFISLMQVGSYYFYFLFVEYFLKVKAYSPSISRLLYIGRVVVVLYTIVITFSFFALSSDSVFIIFSIARGLMLLIGLSAIVMSFFKTIPLSGYIAAGSLSLAVCAGASWLSTLEVFYQWNKLPLMETGILIELLCFTLGLGAFSKLEEQQKINLQSELIKSLEENRELQEESIKAIVETQETERTRIGRDLHDDVGAQLSTLKLFLNSMKSKTGKEQEELINYSTTILDSAIHDIRTILINLSPKVLDEYGYVKAVEEMVSKINSSNVLKFELSVHGLEQRLDSKLENSLYRITQELINNSLKYSWAKHIILDVLRRDDRIVLMYEDNGRGCDIEASTRGFGLTNIRTRVKMFNGQVYFDSSPGNGFRCEIELDVLT